LTNRRSQKSPHFLSGATITTHRKIVSHSNSHPGVSHRYLTCFKSSGIIITEQMSESIISNQYNQIILYSSRNQESHIVAVKSCTFWRVFTLDHGRSEPSQCLLGTLAVIQGETSPCLMRRRRSRSQSECLFWNWLYYRCGALLGMFVLLDAFVSNIFVVIHL
jgi:hypothetical protein